MSELLDRIHSRKATVGIVGQGYVGLPLALVFNEAGFTVVGFDSDTAKVTALNKGDIVHQAYRRRARGGGREDRASGTWKDLTDNVNVLAGNLTDQVRNIAKVTTAVANGDLSQKITVDVKGEILELKNTINTMVDQLRSFAARGHARRQGGRHRRQAGRPGRGEGRVGGVWKDLTDNVNSMASNLTAQVRNIALVDDGGRQRRSVEEDHRRRQGRDPGAEEHHQHDGRSAQLASPPRSRASPRRSAPRGSSAARPRSSGVAGIWKDLTDNVNFMARNLTTQVRGIVKVVTAVANGDLKQKIVVEAKGEIAALADTINSMTDTLSHVRRSGHHAWRARSASRGSSAARRASRA